MRKKLGRDHICPERDRTDRAIMRIPPAQYNGSWYLAMAPARRLTPRVMGTRTRAKPPAKMKVSGSRRQRRFFTAPAR
ncbi:hypothetical protein GCM10022262_42370 [Georgenia daeguensis]|uniref:Uncharacterized protein n=1 Tax=Georgenia daeguensis TaxID=908355 RepID=A0ABP6UND1_9MICO